MTGWAIDRLAGLVAGRPTPAGGRPLHRLRRDRQGDRDRGHRVPGCTPSSCRPRPPRTGPSATWPAPAVELHVGDMADALPELDGTVDLVIANPPYIPLDAYESVAPEVRDHDPSWRLFSGDGRAGRDPGAGPASRPGCCATGGLLCFEHADVQGESAPAVVRRPRRVPRPCGTIPT